MDIYSARFRLGSEHKEFVKDVTNVIISYTPLSGVRDTIRFGQKWISEKRMADRVVRYIERSDRKSFIKSRGRRIRASYEGWRVINPAPQLFPRPKAAAN